MGHEADQFLGNRSTGVDNGLDAEAEYNILELGVLDPGDCSAAPKGPSGLARENVRAVIVGDGEQAVAATLNAREEHLALGDRPGPLTPARFSTLGFAPFPSITRASRRSRMCVARRASASTIATSSPSATRRSAR